MAKKKGAAPKLPRHDRSRSLPVRTGWGLWKTLTVASVVGAVVWFIHSPDAPSLPAQPTQAVSPQ